MRFEDLDILDFNENEKAQDEVSQENPEMEENSISEKNERFNWKKELKSFGFTLFMTLVIVFVLKNYIIINATIPTGSMENTIMPDDNILGFRLSYIIDEPKRGDVIFFYFPDDESQKFVKRVIGLPGETVTIIDGKMYINGSSEPFDEPYLKEEWTRGTGPFVFDIPEDSYLCLGDNRNRSADAREWRNPYVAKDKIIGKAIFTYFPFDRWGIVE
jgi:signal peptidase I